MLLFLRELSGSTGMANWNGQSLSLRSILESLPPMQERYLRTLLPQEEWASLQGVLNGSVGMRGFFSLYRRAQNWSDRGYSTAARCMFLALTEVCQSSAWGGEGKKLADRARRRAEVLSGGGSFLDRFEYEARPLLSSLLDPVNMAAYVVGAPSYRWAKSMSLGRLLRTESVLGKVPFAIELLSSGVGLAVESGAFLGVSKLGHGFQGVHQDWSLSSLGREYGKTVADFGLMKIGGRLGVKAGGSLRGRADVLGSMLPDVGVYGGIVLSHPLGVWGGWNEEKSWSWVLGQSLVTMLHQKAAGRISDVLLMSHLPGLRRYQQGLEMEAQRLSREYFDRLRGRLISPQGYGEYAWALGSWGKGPMRFLSEGGKGSSDLVVAKDLCKCLDELTLLNSKGLDVQELLILDYSTWVHVAEALCMEVSVGGANFGGHPLLERRLSTLEGNIRERFQTFRDLKTKEETLRFSIGTEYRDLLSGLMGEVSYRDGLKLEREYSRLFERFSSAYQARRPGEMREVMKSSEGKLSEEFFEGSGSLIMPEYALDRESLERLGIAKAVVSQWTTVANRVLQFRSSSVPEQRVKAEQDLRQATEIIARAFGLSRVAQGGFDSIQPEGLAYKFNLVSLKLGLKRDLAKALNDFFEAYSQSSAKAMRDALEYINEEIYFANEPEAFAREMVSQQKEVAPSQRSLALRRDGVLRGMAMVDLLGLAPQAGHSGMAEQLRDTLDRSLIDPDFGRFQKNIRSVAKAPDWLPFSLPLLLAHHQGDVGKFLREYPSLPEILSRQELESTQLALRWLSLGFTGHFEPGRQVEALKKDLSTCYPAWESRLEVLSQVVEGSYRGDPAQLQEIFGVEGGQAALGHALYQFYRHHHEPLEGFLAALQSPPEIRAQVVSLLGAAYGSQGGTGAFPYVELRAQNGGLETRGGIPLVEDQVRGLSFPERPQYAEVIPLRGPR